MSVSFKSQLKATRPAAARPSRSALVCHAGNKPGVSFQQVLTAGAAAAVTTLLASQAAFAEFRLPPIDPDPKRCERGFVGNTIGQANAVSDKVLDLRKCSFKGANLSTRVLAGALMSEADLTGTNLQEAVLTKAYAVDANFEGADMTNAVVDRVDFTNANLKGVRLVNAVVTGATFDGADLTGTVWEDALVGNEDVKRLCKNPTLVGDSRAEVGCRQ